MFKTRFKCKIFPVVISSLYFGTLNRQLYKRSTANGRKVFKSEIDILSVNLCLKCQNCVLLLCH